MGTAVRTSRLAGIALLAAHAVALPLAAAVINVGSGPAGECEAANLDDALALAAATTAADEIRLLADFDYPLSTPLHLTDWNASAKGALTLAGGFSDCADTTPDDAHPSELELNSSQPAITVDATGAGGSFVTLRRLQVVRTLGPASGKGIVVTAGGTLNLQRAEAVGFPAGGIAVDGDSTVTVDDHSSIWLNGGASVDGGGVHCEDAGSFVYVDGAVHDNTGASGGGFYLGQGCELALGPNANAYENDAALGGGIAAAGGAVLSAVAGAAIHHNSASSSGGGLYAEGAATQVQLLGTLLTYNDAGFGGGGLYVTAGADVTLDGTGTCTGSNTPCRSLLFHNMLDPGAQHGAAARVANGATLTLHQTDVRESAVDEGETHGSVLFAEGGGALHTESVEVAFNTGADAVFQIESGSTLQVAFTTVAYNHYSTGGGLAEAVGVKLAGSGTTGRINTSIFYPTAGFSASGGASWAQIDCLITQSLLGILGSGSFVFVTDPLYASVADADLRPGSQSPAVDFCDAALYAPTQADLDGRARGYDHPSNANGQPGVPGGRQDAGAYELHDILTDGFETANTTRWSDTEP